MKCGTDICSVKRMQETIEKMGEKFLNRVFTEQEIAYCDSKKLTKYEHYAARFAGKEAVYKAIAPSKDCEGTFIEVEILNEETGKPYVVLHGALKAYAENYQIEISLSHEKEFAIAMVVANKQ